MPANINVTNSTPDWETNLKASLEKAGFNSQERQDKIIANIANELQKKSTTEPTERDIFEAASKVYKFNNTTNLGLAKAIDGFDGFDGNIVLSESKAQWIGAGAVSNKDEREQPDDSRNIIDRSIERIKAKNRTTNGTTEITVDDIIKDLKEKNVITVNHLGKVTKNKHLHDNLVAMKDQCVTAEEIIKATNSDKDWDELIGTVKETEFQRVLIQDSINKIKKTNQNITVDDIIQEIKVNDKIHDRESLLDTLVAMKNQGITTERITQATKDSTAWNKLIGTVKENQNITVDSIIRYT